MELEEKLKVLMESPFFKDFTERATVLAKLKTMENELQLSRQQVLHLKETNVRLETENKLRVQEIRDMNVELKKKYEECKEQQMQLSERDKQLAPFKDLNNWDNDQFLKVLGNLKWTGEDPAWRKIEFIDRTYLDSDDPNVLRKEIEHLKLEKGELAAHLEKT
jgi:protein fantom